IQPILERMTLVIESAKTATVEAKSQVRAGMEAAQLDLEKHMHMTMDIFDQVMTDSVSTVEQSHVAKPTTGPRGTGRRTARAGSAAALPTPPVTRGSGTPVADPVKTRKRIAVAGRKPFGGANG
ncbi:hypothetical protein, partial [Macrococcoides canis]|uniref:hypothetical protein n=1 Tax=Macrococcoides canis TaxID=1855823 RepID=UPI001AA06E1C